MTLQNQDYRESKIWFCFIQNKFRFWIQRFRCTLVKTIIFTDHCPSLWDFHLNRCIPFRRDFLRVQSLFRVPQAWLWYLLTFSSDPQFPHPVFPRVLHTFYPCYQYSCCHFSPVFSFYCSWWACEIYLAFLLMLEELITWNKFSFLVHLSYFRNNRKLIALLFIYLVIGLYDHFANKFAHFLVSDC